MKTQEEENEENRASVFGKIFVTLSEKIFHPSNKQRLKLISCFGYESFPFQLESIQREARSMSHRRGALCVVV